MNGRCARAFVCAVSALLMAGRTNAGARQAPPPLWSASAGDARAGGDTTVWDDGPTAYGRALANLDPARWREMRAGKQRFVRRWPQKGPWADAEACSDCHYRDGRGPRFRGTDVDLAYLLRLGGAAPGAADRTYGMQLRRVGYGTPAPGAFSIDWEEHSGRYRSGEPYTLRRPRIRIRGLAYGHLDASTRLSLRVPPPTFGLGLLEAVTEDEIAAGADPVDRDRDGISGSVKRVRDAMSGRPRVGRFGWKANHSSLVGQCAAALAEDLGVTSPLAPFAIGPVHVAADGRHRPDPEVGIHDVYSLVRYLRGLAPPAQRELASPLVAEGHALFVAVGCDACHRARFTTGNLSGWPELSRQSIHPYTDLLLHDMGAELGDDVAEGTATGREWRTPPLWGLGLSRTVSGDAGLMHDGRARDPDEAILWHGGEAARARDRFVALPAEKRAALAAFLDSL